MWCVVSWINLPPNHVNDVFRLTWKKCIYTTLWNLKWSFHTVAHVLPLSCQRNLESNSKIHPISTVASKFVRFKLSWLKRDCERRRHWRMAAACRNDDMIQLGPLRSRSLFQFVQISDEYFEHFSGNISHTPVSVIINWIQFRRIWIPQLMWNKVSSFFL